MNSDSGKNILSDQDRVALKKSGYPLESIQSQLKAFEKGSSFVVLDRPCILDEGILSLDSREMESLSDRFKQARKEGRLQKFVPASGAATRMFQSLLYLNNAYDQIDDRLLKTEDPEKEKNLQYFRRFVEELRCFAFIDDLTQNLKDNGEDLKELLNKGDYKKILRTILDPDGLNYSNLPKALIPFHHYPDGARTSLEDHLFEGLRIFSDSEDGFRIHYTVSEEHREKIRDTLDKLTRKFKREGYQPDIGLSIQKKSTDTIAVDLDNLPFRDDDGNLVFRPGGHGSLLANLSDLEGDIVFIKNIDNVPHVSKAQSSDLYKEVLGGLLLNLQGKVFEFIEKLESPNISTALLNEVEKFSQQFGIDYDRSSGKGKREYFLEKLNRPIRVCGMVKNMGDAGGGPFWVRGKDGALTPQIVESSQVDLSDSTQYEIFHSSTHFNPVDIVCGMRDYKGKNFDLSFFSDPESFFIAVKSFQGKPLKAYEHPGLWNGQMAHWLTVFLEVPYVTFSPVKNVLDLLNPQHLP